MIGKYVARALQAQLEGEGAEAGEVQVAWWRRHGITE
jgi:hypothetical protein